MHEAHQKLLGVVLDNFDVGRSRAQGRRELGSHLVAGDVLPGPLQPGHSTVGGEDGCLRLHLRCRQNDDEVLLWP